jgi:hypothetical protein
MWIQKRKSINFHFIMKDNHLQYEIKARDQDKIHLVVLPKINSLIF